MNRRALIVLLLTAVAAIAARVAVSAPAHQARSSGALACGVERWRIKTLQDRPRLIGARPTTVAHLVGVPRPASVPTYARLASERRIYSVTAAVTLVREESDQDLHLVLQVGRNHMIAEAPNAPFCTVGATALRKKQMRQARDAVKLCAKARVGRGRVFRLLPRTDGRGSERDRTPPDSWVCVSLEDRAAGTTAAAAWQGQVRGVLSDGLHPASSARRELQRHSRSQLPGSLGRCRPDPHYFDGDRDGIGCEH